MASAIFIGDELTATGFRLAGIELIVPVPEAASAAFKEARSRAGLVIMTAALARHLPAADLEAALLAETPSVALIPDMRHQAPLPDLTRRLRTVLGIEP